MILKTKQIENIYLIKAIPVMILIIALIIYGNDFILKYIFPIAFTITTIYNYFIIKTREYIVNNKEIIATGGILTNTKKIVPFNKITNYTIQEDFIQKIFNAKSILIYTAGQNGNFPELKLRDIHNNAAKKIEEIISKKII